MPAINWNKLEINTNWTIPLFSLTLITQEAILFFMYKSTADAPLILILQLVNYYSSFKVTVIHKLVISHIRAFHVKKYIRGKVIKVWIQQIHCLRLHMIEWLQTALPYYKFTNNASSMTVLGQHYMAVFVLPSYWNLLEVTDRTTYEHESALYINA